MAVCFFQSLQYAKAQVIAACTHAHHSMDLRVQDVFQLKRLIVVLHLHSPQSTYTLPATQYWQKLSSHRVECEACGPGYDVGSLVSMSVLEGCVP